MLYFSFSFQKRSFLWVLLPFVMSSHLNCPCLSNLFFFLLVSRCCCCCCRCRFVLPCHRLVRRVLCKPRCFYYYYYLLCRFSFPHLRFHLISPLVIFFFSFFFLSLLVMVLLNSTWVLSLKTHFTQFVKKKKTRNACLIQAYERRGVHNTRTCSSSPEGAAWGGTEQAYSGGDVWLLQLPCHCRAGVWRRNVEEVK